VRVPGSKELELVRPSLIEYPFLLITALRTVSVHFSSVQFGAPFLASDFHLFYFEQFWTAIVVFAPLLWTEIRWW
jgi:hypothetical protein